MQTLRSVALVVMSMLLMVALGAAQSPQNRRVSTLGDGPWEFDTADYRIRVVKMIGNLDRPWGMTWLPDGTMLLTERPGRLRIVRNGLLDPQPISGVPTVLFKDFDGLEEFEAAGTVVARDGGNDVTTPHDKCNLIMPRRVPVKGERVLRFAREVT